MAHGPFNAGGEAAKSRRLEKAKEFENFAVIATILAHDEHFRRHARQRRLLPFAVVPALGQADRRG